MRHRRIATAAPFTVALITCCIASTVTIAIACSEYIVSEERAFQITHPPRPSVVAYRRPSCASLQHLIFSLPRAHHYYRQCTCASRTAGRTRARRSPRSNLAATRSDDDHPLPTTREQRLRRALQETLTHWHKTHHRPTNNKEEKQAD